MNDAAPAKSNTMAVLCHLSMLIGYTIPFGNILGPVVLWAWKRKEDPDVDYHGRETINFQISMTIYTLCAAAVMLGYAVAVKMAPPELAVKLLWLMPVFVLPVIVAGLSNLILTIIAAVKASNGVQYRYPFTIRFVK